MSSKPTTNISRLSQRQPIKVLVVLKSCNKANHLFTDGQKTNQNNNKGYQNKIHEHYENLLATK